MSAEKQRSRPHHTLRIGLTHPFSYRLSLLYIFDRFLSGLHSGLYSERLQHQIFDGSFEWLDPEKSPAHCVKDRTLPRRGQCPTPSALSILRIFGEFFGKDWPDLLRGAYRGVSGCRGSGGYYLSCGNTHHGKIERRRRCFSRQTGRHPSRDRWKLGCYSVNEFLPKPIRMQEIAQLNRLFSNRLRRPCRLGRTACNSLRGLRGTANRSADSARQCAGDARVLYKGIKIDRS